MTRKTGVLTNASRFPDRWIELDSGPIIVTPASVGNHFKVRLTENCTVEPPSSPHDGQRITWWFIQPAAGGVSVSFNSVAFSTGNGSAVVSTGAEDSTYVEARYAQQEGSWTVLGTGGGLTTDDLVDSSTGSGDAGKGVKLDTDGYLDPTLVETGTSLTLTYSSSTSTHANPTTQTLTDNTNGTADGWLGEIVGTSQDSEINNNFATLLAEHNAMRVDLLNLKQFVNQYVIDAQNFKKPG